MPVATTSLIATTTAATVANHGFFALIFYIPLYNALIFCIDLISSHSAGWAVILLTIIIRIILFPLARQAIKTQLQMKQIEPELQKLRATIKDKQEQAKKMMELYKERDVHPFAGFLLLLIQLPILIALYQVFRSGLPMVNASLLYSFVKAPASVSMGILGISLLGNSFILALLAVVTQFIQLQLALPTPVKPQKDQRSFQDDLAYSMNVQMKYILPLLLFPVAYISPVIALYLIAANTFMIFQELFVRRRMAKKYVPPVTQ
jgi:YidC/Oxa1 family membrane protein insertase